MMNPFNFFKNRRKNKKLASLQEVEHLLHSASYPAAKPTTEFTQQLQQKLLKARRSNKSFSMEAATSYLGSFKWKLWAPAVAFAVIILLLVPLVSPFFGEKFLLVDRAYAESAFEVTAVESDQSGVSTTTPFKITTKEAVDVDDVREHLRFEPELKFNLKKVSDTEFELTPSEDLAPATVYNVVIDAAYRDERSVVIPKEFRFAFQVKDTFKILKTLPGDRATRVPLETGIELTFSHPTVALDDVKKHFSITPEVAGRFEQHKRVFAFVPKKPLAPQTLYTIKVGKEMPLASTEQTLGKDFSAQFFTDQNPDSGAGGNAINFGVYGQLFPAFSPQENPEFAVSVAGELPRGDAVKVYKLSPEAIQKYLTRSGAVPDWVCFNCYSHFVYTQKLPLVLTTTLADVVATSPDTPRNSVMSMKLPPFKDAGIYVIESEHSTSQQLFQVSNLKALLMVSKTKLLLWVHDARSKKPLESATAELGGAQLSGETNSKGYMLADTPDCAEGKAPYDSSLLSVKAGGDHVYLFADYSCNEKPHSDIYQYYNSNNYWTTFSTDRRIYLPSDTVQFWGVAKKRAGSGGGDEQFTIELRADADLVASTSVTSSDLGTLHGKIDLRNVRPGYYSVLLRTSGGETIVSKSLEVSTFQKPLYDLKVSTDKDAVFVGEPIKATIDAAFFDGTPAANMQLEYTITAPSMDGKVGLVTTDSRGHADVTIDTSLVRDPAPEYFNNSLWMMINFHTVNAEYGLSQAEAQAVMFRADAFITQDYGASQNAGKVIGNVLGIDITKYNGANGDFQKSLPNYKVSGEVFEVINEKVETGRTYDPIAKISYPQYTYNRRLEKRADVSAETGEKGNFTVEYPFEVKKEYELHFNALDRKGRNMSSTMTYMPPAPTGLQSVASPDQYRNIFLADTKFIDGKPAPQYAVGDRVGLQLFVDDKKPYEDKADFLFVQAQNGIMDVAYSDVPKYEFTFGKNHVPNVHVAAAIFDGKRYQDTWTSGNGADVYFKKDLNKLSIDITTDQEKYKPGQPAVVSVVTKNADGKAVSAEVNLKLIDEAIYALTVNGNGEMYDSYDDPLNELYAYVWPGIAAVTSTNPFFRGDKGGGGGGDGDYRRVFKNTAYFDSVRTDSDGRASVTVKLPDDLTTFRITAQGVTENLEAGVARKKLTTSLDFFADVTMNDTYLTSDQPQIRLRAFGKAVKKDTETTFTISIPTLFEKEKAIVVKGGKESWYALPKLTPGVHEVRVSAEASGTAAGPAGDLKDAIAKKITVVDSLLTAPVSETRTLTDGAALADISAPRAKLVFSLNPYGAYYEALQRLQWAYSGRLDARLAAKVVTNLLAQYYGEAKPEHEIDLNAYQHEFGGLGLFPYDDADLDLTVRAAYFAENNFDKLSLEQYFDRVLEKPNSNQEEIALALAGKAVLKLPVLNDVKMFAALNDAKLKPREKLILAFALATLGDSSGAQSLLNSVAAEKTTVEGDSLELSVSKDAEENKELTALAATIAALTSDVDAPRYWNAVTKTQTTETLTNLEEAIMLDAFLKHLPPVQEGRLRYTLGDHSEKITLKKSQTEALLISGDDFKNLNFSDLNGPVAVTVYYDAPFAKANQQLSKTLSVARRYEVDGKKATTFPEGKFVRVFIHPIVSGSQDKGEFEVIDTLPAGLLPLATTNIDFQNAKGGYGGAPIAYPYFVEGQRVAFRFYRNIGNQTEISYLARIVSKGTFNAEPVLLQSSSNPTRLTISEPAQIEIK